MVREVPLEAAGTHRKAAPSFLWSWPVTARPQAASPDTTPYAASLLFFNVPVSKCSGSSPETRASGIQGPSPAMLAGSPQSGPVPGSSVLRLVAPPVLWYSQAAARTHPAGSWGLYQSGGRSGQSAPNLVEWREAGGRTALRGALELLNSYEKRTPKLQVWILICLQPLPCPRKSLWNISSEFSRGPFLTIRRECDPFQRSSTSERSSHPEKMITDDLVNKRGPSVWIRTVLLN